MEFSIMAGLFALILLLWIIYYVMFIRKTKLDEEW
jgi:hypothetical protein